MINPAVVNVTAIIDTIDLGHILGLRRRDLSAQAFEIDIWREGSTAQIVVGVIVRDRGHGSLAIPVEQFEDDKSTLAAKRRIVDAAYYCTLVAAPRGPAGKWRKLGRTP